MGKSFDGDRHRRSTEVRLVIGGYLILLVVGGALVWVLYGRGAALTAVGCLLATSTIAGLLWLALSLLERWVRDDEP